MARTGTRTPARRAADSAVPTEAAQRVRAEQKAAAETFDGTTVGYVAHLTGLTREDLAAAGIR